ncbi:MAG: hypothetical protein CUN49_02420 [Candidatus Thermofonsia Clade 1 bacterium]|jgi:hypothetical protein|uniref:Uncharacterized protein n=1 Tax=Candidatus Thermofonsia Clade 1 bacterium TaxID=2364210 RepID=A0A2M8PYU7_9CHLR|nr:MAG: hypothetical protein CUN49_02420 [Candidatus Thermofonsia Clade 1 bacterium]PJF42725.1 MAG: hypothetical protein CUN50_03025 [Candidatus Thermofonsia Clade 1 bacterium]RMF52539.1 MAG: hypothetical protein D6749_04620 [Chloroflexota bacterium]
MPIDIDKGFMELVQLHEREWGTEMYPHRPSLAELLNAPIVAMWASEVPRSIASSGRSVPRQLSENRPYGRFMLSVHQRLEELDPILSALIVAGKTAPFPNRKLLRLFVQQKPVRILGVRLLLDPSS